MPERVVHDLVRLQPIDVLDDAPIRRLASRFAVSAQALTIRLTRLSLLACNVTAAAQVYNTRKARTVTVCCAGRSWAMLGSSVVALIRARSTRALRR
jgi:Zn-dependent peptidase ImmA (M78 family)